MVKGIILAVCLGLATHTATAGDKGFIVNIGSKHVIDNDRDYNEKNYGIGYSHYVGNNTRAVQLGVYNNSVNRWSVYVAGKFYFNEKQRVRPYFLIAIATGYENYTIVPIPALGLDFEIIKSHKLNAMLGPLVSGTTLPVDGGGKTTEQDYGMLFAIQYEKLF